MTAIALEKPKPSVRHGLFVAWSIFWIAATFPIHVLLVLAGGKGFRNGTPVWAMLLTFYVAVCVGFGI